MRRKYYLILLSILCICSACTNGDGYTKQVVSDKNVMEDDAKDNTENNTREESKVENDSKQPNTEGEKQGDMVVENIVEENGKYDTNFEEMFEAENGKFTGKVKVDSKKEGFSGVGYVEGFEEDSDTCTVTIQVPGSGLYDISIICASFSGYKENFVCLDGEQVGVVKVKSADFTDSILEKVYIAAGMHEITIKKSWGWIYLDAIKVVASAPVDESVYKVSADLVDPGATDSAKRLMQYIIDSYGKVILSGQTADEGMNSTEFKAIRNASGKTPAILGLDFMEYSPSRIAHGSKGKAVDYAIEFSKAGGIVTFCWHWNAPEKYLHNTKENQWWSGFYTTGSNINLTDIMNGKDKEGYELLLKDIDAIAVQLGRLQEEDISILWRPLHEASGGWFWWGASGAKAYKELWKLLYERLTNYHGLHNLIWVWNGQSNDWYPGDEYVDIIGEDIYPGEKNYTSQSSKFNDAVKYTDTRKVIAMTENGCLFDPDLAFRDEARWAWFTTWQDEFVTLNGTYTLSEQYTEKYMVNKVYNHEKVITLDELPKLR